MATTTVTCLLMVWALVAAGLFDTALTRASVAPPTVGKERREFDYSALAPQWPGTICSSTRHCCTINVCCRSEALHTFTIYGLWPDYNDRDLAVVLPPHQLRHGQGASRRDLTDMWPLWLH
ncbi:hypothetical protein VPH35_069458 [Triticum aestivum]